MPGCAINFKYNCIFFFFFLNLEMNNDWKSKLRNREVEGARKINVWEIVCVCVERYWQLLRSVLGLSVSSGWVISLHLSSLRYPHGDRPRSWPLSPCRLAQEAFPDSWSQRRRMNMHLSPNTSTLADLSSYHALWALRRLFPTFLKSLSEPGTVLCVCFFFKVISLITYHHRFL